jgi:acetyltransferase-like isoleucine patch superfamily enzyme
MIREENEIGDDVSIGTNSVVEHHVKIGNKVRMHTGVFVPEYTIIEEGAWIGPKVAITNARFPLGKDIKQRLEGVTIKKNVKIGANATILPGVTIGENSLIGAGSVVISDVPENSVAVGNPAKVIKKVDELKYDDGVKPYD